MPRKKGLKKVPKKPPFKFNVKEILEERKRFAELSKESAETVEQMKAYNDMLKLQMKNIFDEDDNKSPLVLPKLDFVFDNTKYNIPFSESSYTDNAESCSQRLLIMSIEQNELQTNIHYNHLMNAKWSPELNVCLVIIVITYVISILYNISIIIKIIHIIFTMFSGCS